MRQFLAVTKMAINDAIIYRDDMFIWAVSLMIGPLVFLLVWLAVISSGGNPPLSKNEFIQYFLLVMAVRLWANSSNANAISNGIREGNMSKFLLKPLSFFSYRFGDNVGVKLIKGLLGFVVVLVLGFLFQVTIPVAGIDTWLLFLVSVFIGGLILWLIDMNIGLLAFWLDDISSIEKLFTVFFAVSSGILMPITLYPQFFQELLVYLPFKYAVAFPIELLLKQTVGLDLLVGLTIQIFWLGVCLLGYKFLWAKGLVKYQAFGS